MGDKVGRVTFASGGFVRGYQPSRDNVELSRPPNEGSSGKKMAEEQKVTFEIKPSDDLKALLQECIKKLERLEDDEEFARRVNAVISRRSNRGM